MVYKIVKVILLVIAVFAALILGIFAISAGLVFYTSTDQKNQEINFGIEDFCLENLDGKEIFLEDISNQPKIINLWATWCKPCIKEFKEFDKFIKTTKNNSVYFISDEPLDRIIMFKEKTNYNFNFLRNKEKFSTLGIYQNEMSLRKC